MTSHLDPSRRKLLSQGLAAATAAALPAFSLPARAQGRPVLKAGDQKGGLRARAEPGKAGWSDDDLLCRSERAPSASAKGSAQPADGLGALIARMDAEPVRFVKGGFIH